MKGAFLPMDETIIKCNKEHGKKSSSKSYMWVMCSGEEENQVLYFHYTQTRHGDHAKRFLVGYKNYYVTDAYVCYHKVDIIANVHYALHYVMF